MEHMKEFHPDAERFNCPTCGYLAISRSNLDYHIQCVHESGTQRNCTMCEFSADNNRNLVKHFKEVHDRMHPFHCGTCKYRYVNVINIRIVMKSCEPLFYSGRGPKMNCYITYTRNIPLTWLTMTRNRKCLQRWRSG